MQVPPTVHFKRSKLKNVLISHCCAEPILNACVLGACPTDVGTNSSHCIDLVSPPTIARAWRLHAKAGGRQQEAASGEGDLGLPARSSAFRGELCM